MKAPSRKTVKSWAFNIALLVGVYMLVQAYHARNAPQSGPAPDFQTVDLNGQSIELKQYQGQATLVYFWATWCGVCSMTRGSIDNIAQDHPVITVASQSGSNQEIKTYQQQHQFNVTIVNDDDGQISQAYGVQAFPSVFILDSKGNISDVEIGLSSEWGLRLRLWWASI